MRLFEKDIAIPVVKDHQDLLSYIDEYVSDHLDENQIPVRIVFSKTDALSYHVELGILECEDSDKRLSIASIFNYKQRQCENVDKFNAVLLIPTGIGAELGGHSGDGGPLSRLMAQVCDTLITHPNVVNAADVNELPDNGLYVEGSVISRFMMGVVGLQKVRANRVALIIENHADIRISEYSINAASTARATLGLDCLVVRMEENINMYSSFSPSGRAVGKIDHLQRMIDVLEEHRDKFDAIAISSVINVPMEYHTEYFLGDMINPWGGVEAILTHAISSIFNIPSAHAPMVENQDILNISVGIVDPRMAAETVSTTYLHCVFKGMHRSPKIITDESQFINPNVITASDISCLVIPDGCIGLPTLAALEQGIPVIAVRENKNIMQNNLADLPFRDGKLFIVDNYLDAVGIMTVIKTGLALDTVRRPLAHTKVVLELT